MVSTGRNNVDKRLEFVVAGILGIVVFFTFTIWGGIPTDERTGQFWLLVVILFVFLCGFVGITWHLMFRRLPEKHKTPAEATLSTNGRRFLALVLALGALSLVVGPFWDEIWHRTFGIPFGQDFFWPPHFLIYFGFGVGIILGFWGLYFLTSRYKGTFQQRFRANPLIGLVVLSAAFLMYVVPADPIWHFTYGRDISAWSVPHLLLLISIASIMLLSAKIHLSTVASHDWHSIRHISLNEILPLLMFAAIMMPWLQILIIDWDSSFINPDRVTNRFRPEWLLAANVVFTAAFAGTVANRSLRCVGAATVIGVLALGMRVALIEIFNIQELMRFNAWLLALAPLIAIDLWMGFALWIRKREARWYETGIAAAVGMVITAPLIVTLYPILTLTNILILALAVVLAGLGASWLGAKVGEHIATTHRYMTEETAGYSPLVSLGTFATYILFIVFFISTAPPPV